MENNEIRRRAPLGFAVFSLFCFLVSLALPSVHLTVLGAPTEFSGLQATAWAIGLSAESLLDVIAGHKTDQPALIILGVPATLNILFFIAPALIAWSPQKPVGLYVVAVLSFIGLALAIFSPIAISRSSPHVLPGYFVWLIGYTFLSLATATSLKEKEKRPIDRSK